MRARLLSVLISFALTGASVAQTTAFTYQGELKDNDQLANGSYDFYIEVYTQASGGVLFTDDCFNDVPVTNGRFTVDPNLGVLPAGETYFLDIQARRHTTGVDCGTSTGFTRLAPRQVVTATPFANLARVAMGLSSPDGSPSSAVFVNSDGNVSMANNLAVTGNSTVAGNSSISGNSTIFGRLSVGVSPPSAPIHVRLDDPFLILQDSGSAATQSGYLGFWNNAGTETAWTGFGTPGSPHFSVVNARASGNIVLSPLAGSVVLSPSSGHVGIGTSAPIFPLHIVAEEPVIVLSDSGTNSEQSGYLGFRNGSGTETAWVGYGTPGSPDFSVVNARSGGDILLLPAANVGIGTSTPTFRLDVAGNVRCTSLTQTSSAAYKDEVAPLAAGLGELLRLEPVSYVWNEKAPEDSRGKHDLGFLAEDVAGVLPDAVARDAEGTPAGVDYSRITVLAVKAIQEQNARHEADRAEIASLRERLARLESLLNSSR